MRRKLSPSMTKHQDQQTASSDPPTLPLACAYVILPRHPLYGRRVHVRCRRPFSTGVECVVAPVDDPAFRYRLPERWLAPVAPPSLPVGAAAPVRLPLAALDKLTQRLLGVQRMEAADVHPGAHDPGPHLGAAPGALPVPPDEPAGDPAALDSRGGDR